MELDLQSLFGLHVHSCTHWLRPRNSPPPSPRIWAHIRRRYWSAKIDDISLQPPGFKVHFVLYTEGSEHIYENQHISWKNMS